MKIYDQEKMELSINGYQVLVTVLINDAQSDAELLYDIIGQGKKLCGQTSIEVHSEEYLKSYFEKEFKNILNKPDINAIGFNPILKYLVRSSLASETGMVFLDKAELYFRNLRKSLFNFKNNDVIVKNLIDRNIIEVFDGIDNMNDDDNVIIAYSALSEEFNCSYK